ncbi:MAG: recombinase family protein [Eubacteriales bacterium]|nr:recombinase family protein [Eubacteriales bacterium]
MRKKGNLVAIYCRLSKEDLEKTELNCESESIKNQKAMLETYAKEKGWAVYDYYIDEDYSGSDRNRPEFNRLITDSIMNRFGIVLCKKQSRFARDIEFVERYIHGLFVEKQIRFVSLLDNIDTGLSKQSFSKTSRINSLIDEWYLEDLSHNITSALTTKRKNGEFIGSWAPYGYKKDPKNKNHLVSDPDAAKIVLRIFQLYSCGYGMTAIAQILNQDGILNPLGYKRQTLKSTLWTAGTISYILKNQTYIGHLVQGKFKKVSYKSKQLIRLPEEQWIIVRNCHEKIIEPALWDQVQKQLNARTRIRGQRRKHHVLTGKIYCGECGEKLLSGGGRSGKRKTNYLCCSTRHRYKEGCVGARIEQKKLESMVLEQICQLSEQFFDLEYLMDHIDFNVNNVKGNTLKKQAENLQLEINKYKNKIEEAYLDKLNGIISQEHFLSLRNYFKIHENKLETRLHNIHKEIAIREQATLNEPNKQEFINQFRNPTVLTRDYVDHLIKSIFIFHKDQSGAQKILIHWNI